jgi:hypothetical protein
LLRAVTREAGREAHSESFSQQADQHVVAIVNAYRSKRSQHILDERFGRLMN